MLGRRRRSRVLRENREVEGKMPLLLGRMEKFSGEQIALGAIDLVTETSEALEGLIKLGLVEEFTDDKGVQRYRIVEPIPDVDGMGCSTSMGLTDPGWRE